MRERKVEKNGNIQKRIEEEEEKVYERERE